MLNLRKKVLGCILGGAIGDALGAPFEGLWAENIPESEVLIKEFSLFEGYPPGQFTDDTQLTLKTLESIVKCGFINPSHIAKSIFELWKNQTVIGPGGACGYAASEFFLHKNWQTCGAPEGNAGNGTAMRTAALGFCFLEKPEKLAKVVADISRITHQDKRSVAGGVAIAQASLYLCQNDNFKVLEFCENVAESITEIDKETAEYILELPELVKKDEIFVINKISWAGMKYPEFNKPIITPFVVPTVLASLYSIIKNIDSWSDAVSFAIRLGGDVDSLGAIVGGLMGARLGIDFIPIHLREQVVDPVYLQQLGEKYLNLVNDKFYSSTLLKLYI